MTDEQQFIGPEELGVSFIGLRDNVRRWYLVRPFHEEHSLLSIGSYQLNSSFTHRVRGRSRGPF